MCSKSGLYPARVRAVPHYMPRGMTAIIPSHSLFSLLNIGVQLPNVLLGYFLHSGHKIITWLNPINGLSLVYQGQVTYPIEHPCGEGGVEVSIDNYVYIIYLIQFFLQLSLVGLKKQLRVYQTSCPMNGLGNFGMHEQCFLRFHRSSMEMLMI